MKTGCEMKNGATLQAWIPLVGLTCAAFIFNTSEFVPIGLLSDIAADFGVTEARVGMIVSVYAWVVMLLSLPFMLLVSKMEMRKLLLWTVFLFVVFQFLSSVSTGYVMLLASRIGVACTHAVFWSVVSPVAVRIADEKHRALALSMIVTGTSVAMILGLPLGRVIGLHIGWRSAFFCVGLFALSILCYLWFVLPLVPSRGKVGIHQLPRLFRIPMLMKIYVLALLVPTAYYTGYSYIEPFLKQVAGMADGWITAMLMLFGAAGIAGSFSFSRYYDKSPVRFLTVTLFTLMMCLFLMLPASAFAVAVVVLCLAWGIAVTAFNVAMQSEIIRYAPASAVAVSMAVFSGIFNLGIGMGTSVGGFVCTRYSMAYVGLAGGVIALLAFVYWRLRVVRWMHG